MTLDQIQRSCVKSKAAALDDFCCRLIHQLFFRLDAYTQLSCLIMFITVKIIEQIFYNLNIEYICSVLIRKLSVRECYNSVQTLVDTKRIHDCQSDERTKKTYYVLIT